MSDTANKVREAVFKMTGRLDDAAAARPFRDHNVDSFDLLTLRIEIEKILGTSITDGEWTGFRSFEDMFAYCGPSPEPQKAVQANAGARDILINMPQMIAGGLSENWVFKEAGDFHWSKLAAALQKQSDQIADELGNRLYATFLRFRLTATVALGEFVENDRLVIDNELGRFGKGLFFSSCQFDGDGKSIKAELMSSFTSRGGSNKELMKGDPVLPPGDFPVKDAGEMPPFSAGYREMRKGLGTHHELAGELIQLKSDVLFECDYQINPYFDLNGVKLIYFAAYPIIADICERRYVQQTPTAFPVATDYALDVSTIARDVFYFGNLDITDHFIYRLNSFEVRGDHVVSQASLYRASDNTMIAQVFAVKKRLS